MSDLIFFDETIPIEKIIRDDNLKIRVVVDEERVKEFVQLYDQLPPVKIINVDGKYYLADGWHRDTAAQRKNEKLVRAQVAPGEYKDALEIAIKENAKGSLTMSRADKRYAVQKVLMFFTNRANSWIADDVGVAMQTVESVRDEMEKKGIIKHYDELVRRDDKITPRVYQKPVTPIASPKPIASNILLSSTPKTEEEGEFVAHEQLSEEEKADLLKAMGKRPAVENNIPITNTETVNKEILENLRKPTSSPVASNNPSVPIKPHPQPITTNASPNETPVPSDKPKEFFAGINEGLIAETMDSEAKNGIRIRNDKGSIIITIYSKMGEKLFPKATVQLTMEAYVEFMQKCNTQ